MAEEKFIDDYYIKMIQQINEDKRRLEAIKEKIALERQMEYEKKQKRKMIFKKFAGAVTLTALIGTSFGKLYNYNIVDKNNIRYDQILSDMNIHAGYGELQGRYVGPSSEHDCVAPYDGENSYQDRLRESMEGQYSEKVINETVSLFDPLAYGTKEEVKDASKRLEEIKDSLYKNSEGLWETDIISNSRKMK